MVVSGRAYSGWISVNVYRSLDDAASRFAVAGVIRWPGENNPVRIGRDDAITVKIGRDKVLSGYVDNVRFAPGTGIVSVEGRSRTADLVDCSAKPGQYKGLTLSEFASELARPFGVQVVTDTTTFNRQLKRTHVKPGASVYQEIERAARAAGVLVTDDPDGRLCLIRAGGNRSSTRLVVGENILLGAEVSSDMSARYSHYQVRSQTVGDDADYGDAVTSIEGLEEDEGAGRYRLLIIDTPGLNRQDAKNRATWEAATRAGKSVSAYFPVRGWRQGDGRLWEPNYRVRCTDRESGLDGDLLIRSVRYSVDAGGQLAELTVVPELAYQLQQPRTKTPVKGRKRGAWMELADGVTLPEAP